MRKLAGLLLAMLILVFGPSLPHASASGSAEIELIVDYLNRQQVTIILPPGVDPTPLSAQVSDIVDSPLNLLSDWDTEDGVHVWLYAAPHLIHGAGLRKSELWDFTDLAATANQSGLSDGVNLFLVVNQPNGALSYNVYVDDQGTELSPVAADEMEVWWGFGLKPGGGAPKLTVLLWLKPLFSWLTLSPLWIPLVGLLLLWPFRRAKLQFFYRLSTAVSWLTIWASVLLAFLMQWQAVGNFLLGSTDGFPSRATFFFTLLLPFTWAYLLVRQPLHRRLARERRRPWSVGLYLRDSLHHLALLAVLLALGLAWFALAQYLQPFGLWLAVLSSLFASALLLWLATEFLPVFTWGKRPSTDLGAEAMMRSLSDRMQISPPRLHFIPVFQANQANAFAAGTVMTRVYVTQLLWDRLSPGEQQFILAHELAHIKRRDSLRLLASLLLPIWPIAIGTSLVFLVDATWTLTFGVGLLLFSVISTFYVALPYRRRAELAADALALQATEDLPMAISALQRLQMINQAGSSRINQLTHPSLDQRLAAMCPASGNSSSRANQGGN